MHSASDFFSDDDETDRQRAIHYKDQHKERVDRRRCAACARESDDGSMRRVRPSMAMISAGLVDRATAQSMLYVCNDQCLYALNDTLAPHQPAPFQSMPVAASLSSASSAASSAAHLSAASGRVHKGGALIGWNASAGALPKHGVHPFGTAYLIEELRRRFPELPANMTMYFVARPEGSDMFGVGRDRQGRPALYLNAPNGHDARMQLMRMGLVRPDGTEMAVGAGTPGISRPEETVLRTVGADTRDSFNRQMWAVVGRFKQLPPVSIRASDAAAAEHRQMDPTPPTKRVVAWPASGWSSTQAPQYPTPEEVAARPFRAPGPLAPVAPSPGPSPSRRDPSQFAIPLRIPAIRRKASPAAAAAAPSPMTVDEPESVGSPEPEFKPLLAPGPYSPAQHDEFMRHHREFMERLDRESEQQRLRYERIKREVTEMVPYKSPVPMTPEEEAVARASVEQDLAEMEARMARAEAIRRPRSKAVAVVAPGPAGQTTGRAEWAIPRGRAAASTTPSPFGMRSMPANVDSDTEETYVQGRSDDDDDTASTFY